MSFWSGETLKERLPNLLGASYNPERIDCAAYQLSIGGEVYVSPREGEDPSRTKVQLKEGEAFTIPAGQFAFLLTEEIVTIPSTALGFISIRAKIKFRGLVNVSGFHVDPGYSGRLVFSVFNASPAPIHLQRGQAAFLLWLADLDRQSETIRASGNGYYGLPVDIINPIAGEVQSLGGLAAKLDDTERLLSDKLKELEQRVDTKVHLVERDHTYLKGAIALVIALLVFIAGRLIYDLIDKANPSAPPAASSVPSATGVQPGGVPVDSIANALRQSLRADSLDVNSSNRTRPARQRADTGKH